jgi:hypothetical protein
MDSVAEKDVIRLKRLRTSISSLSKVIEHCTNLFTFPEELVSFSQFLSVNLCIFFFENLE